MKLNENNSSDYLQFLEDLINDSFWASKDLEAFLDLHDFKKDGENKIFGVNPFSGEKFDNDDHIIYHNDDIEISWVDKGEPVKVTVDYY